jgi:hypothetical protein
VQHPRPGTRGRPGLRVALVLKAHRHRRSTARPADAHQR